MSKLALPCIVCGKPLKNVFEESDNQPYCGTEFTSYGHYGSTIWDEMEVVPDEDDSGAPLQLVVNICDTCVLRALDDGTIQSRGEGIALSRDPVDDKSRAWVLAQNEQTYGSAWGDDQPVDYREQMLKAGWSEELLKEEQ